MEPHEFALCTLVQKLCKGKFQHLVNIPGLQEEEKAIKKNSKIRLENILITNERKEHLWFKVYTFSLILLESKESLNTTLNMIKFCLVC